MKEVTMRAPDEGELWRNGNSATRYVMSQGVLCQVGWPALETAHSPSAVIAALKDFYGYRGRYDAGPVRDGCDGWQLKADSCWEEVERVVLEKLNAWQEDLRQASLALTVFMS